MNREEAIYLTLQYLTEKDEPDVPSLDYPWMLTSLTEYATCWYVDFRYKHAIGTPPQVSNDEPGFTINKKTKHIQVVCWQELYELNCEYLIC